MQPSAKINPNALQHIRRGGAYDDPLLNMRWKLKDIRSVVDDAASIQSYYRKVEFLKKFVKDLTGVKLTYPGDVGRLPMSFDRGRNGLNTKEFMHVFVLCAWQKSKSIGDQPAQLNGFIAELRSEGWDQMRLYIEASIKGTTSSRTIENLFENAVTKFWQAKQTIEIEQETVYDH